MHVRFLFVFGLIFEFPGNSLGDIISSEVTDLLQLGFEFLLVYNIFFFFFLFFVGVTIHILLGVLFPLNPVVVNDDLARDVNALVVLRQEQQDIAALIVFPVPDHGLAVPGRLYHVFSQKLFYLGHLVKVLLVRFKLMDVGFVVVVALDDSGDR